jgi:hypothetical protein
MLRIGRYTRSATSRYAAMTSALVIVIGVAAVPGQARAASPTVPDPPGAVSSEGTTGGVTVEWTAPGSDGGSPITGYEIAPVVDGAACAICEGAESVSSTTFTLDIPAMAEGVGNSFAVQAVNAVGASAWTYPSPPAATPISDSIYPQSQSGITASTNPNNYSTPLNTPSGGYPNRIVARDGGFAALLGNLGDMWVFDDTVVTDWQGTFPTLTPTANYCFTADGTAAIEPSPLTQLPSLNEYRQQNCTSDGSTPVGQDSANQPHQFLPSYWQGSTECRNWTNGATPGQAPDSAEVSYGSECMPPGNPDSPLGTYVTSYTANTKNATQAISATPAPQGSPVLPPAACPAANYSGDPQDATPRPGEYESVVNDGGFYYFYNPYGLSVDLGSRYRNCSAMALARVPVAYVNTPGDYQYLVQRGGETLWVSPSSSVSAATLAAESANVLPNSDYNGVYAGQVSVGYVGGSNGPGGAFSNAFAMTYILPAAVTNGSTTYVAAVRTAEDPWGPWSAPALYGIADFSWIGDYQLTFHPELYQNSTLDLSWVDSDYFNDELFPSNAPAQQVRFSTLPVSILPTPPPGNEVGTVGMSLTNDGAGHWETASDGTVTPYGDAVSYGSREGKPLNAPIVGMADTKDGAGYWLVASDGGIFTFGDAKFYGSMGGKTLNAPVVGMAAAANGTGYWEVASDGGIFTFGPKFYGSMGGKTLNAPIVGMASTPDGKGYWEVAADGGIFSFGDAKFYGSMAGKTLNAPVVGMTTIGSAAGYVLLGADGGIFTFGPGAVYHGTPSGLTAPAVAISAVSASEYDVVTNTGTDYACTGTCQMSKS